MAPVEKRKIEEEQDESKRAKVEDEVEEDISDEEDFDDEDDFDDDEMDEPDFRPQDFEGVEVSEEEIAKFTEAYSEFIMDLHLKADETKTEPMLLTKPQTIRPVPFTKADFEKSIVVIQLPEEMQQEKVRIAQSLQECNDLEEDNEDQEEFTDEQVAALLLKASKASLDFMNKELDAIDAMVKDDKPKKAFEQTLVFTDMIFDVDTHHAFTETTDVDAVKALLARLAATWKTILANDEEKLGEKGVKAGVEDFVQSCIDDLTKGEFVEDEELNHFKEVSFEFRA